MRTREHGYWGNMYWATCKMWKCVLEKCEYWGTLIPENMVENMDTRKT